MGDTRALVRGATLFYAVLALLAWGWGVVFDSPVLGAAPTAADVGVGFAVGIGIVALCHLSHMLVPPMRRAADVMGEFFGPVRLGDALWLALVSGFAEEICFRGALWRQLGPVGTSILFGLCHVVPLRALRLYPLFAFFVGLLFAELRAGTGSVTPAIVAHVTVNALNIGWLGRREKRRRARRAGVTGDARATEAPRPDRDVMTLPAEFEPGDSFPQTVWRYDLRVDLTGTDRQNLPLCLEGEDLALFRYVPREQVYDELAQGTFVFAQSFAGPLQPFPHDLAAISAYLFQPVIGIEVAERFIDEETTDDVRAWKIVAQRGEWVKVPLTIEAPDEGRFVVDTDHEDLSVVKAQWATYPRWFQDALRFKYPELRGL